MHYGIDLDKLKIRFAQAKNEGRLEQFASEVIPQLAQELKDTRMEVVDLLLGQKPAVKANSSDDVDAVTKMIRESAEAENIFTALQTTQSISEVADTVGSLSEGMAKLVLKKFVYTRGQ